MKKQLAFLVALSVALPQALLASSQPITPMHAATSTVRGEVAPELAPAADSMTECRYLRRELEEHQHQLRKSYRKLGGISLLSTGAIGTILASRYYSRPLPTVLERIFGPLMTGAQTRLGTVVLPTVAIAGLATGVILYSHETNQLQRWIDQTREDMKSCQQDEDLSAEYNDVR